MSFVSSNDFSKGCRKQKDAFVWSKTNIILLSTLQSTKVLAENVPLKNAWFVLWDLLVFIEWFLPAWEINKTERGLEWLGLAFGVPKLPKQTFWAETNCIYNGWDLGFQGEGISKDQVFCLEMFPDMRQKLDMERASNSRTSGQKDLCHQEFWDFVLICMLQNGHIPRTDTPMRTPWHHSYNNGTLQTGSQAPHARLVCDTARLL